MTVLSDTAIRGKDLDEEKANEAKAAAEEALKNAKSDIDIAMAQSELAVMAAQIAALRKYREKKWPRGWLASCSRGGKPRRPGNRPRDVTGFKSRLRAAFSFWAWIVRLRS